MTPWRTCKTKYNNMKCLEVDVWSLVCCENPKLHRSIYCIISCWDKMVKNINLLCNNCKTVWKLYKVGVLYGFECIQSMINYSEDNWINFNVFFFLKCEGFLLFTVLYPHEWNVFHIWRLIVIVIFHLLRLYWFNLSSLNN